MSKTPIATFILHSTPIFLIHYVTGIYRVFIYFKHHVYYVSINSFIYYVSKKTF